jgi:hypothetical protein
MGLTGMNIGVGGGVDEKIGNLMSGSFKNKDLSKV